MFAALGNKKKSKSKGSIAGGGDGQPEDDAAAPAQDPRTAAVIAEVAASAEAAAGLDLLLNDDIPGAERVFGAACEVSPTHALGMGVCASVRAIMSFEEKDVERAMSILSAGESLATARAKAEREAAKGSTSTSSSAWLTGWFKGRSSAVTGSGKQASANGGSAGEEEEPSDSSQLAGLRFDVISADCNLLGAIIAMLTKESISEYLKAALKLRRSLATFNKAFRLLFSGVQDAGEPSSSLSRGEQSPSTSRSGLAELDRTLYAGVYFGVGLWSLLMSHMPSQARALLSFIGLSVGPATTNVDLDVEGLPEGLPEDAPGGFEDGSLSPGGFPGDDNDGPEAQNVRPPGPPAAGSSSSSSDHRFAIVQLRKCLALGDPFHSPLAALVLCSYHTAVSGFASGHGSFGPEASLKESRSILQKMRAQYPRGGIWRIIEGKLLRLDRDAAGAVAVLADEKRACDQKKEGGAMQLNQMASYELAWSYLVEGQAAEAAALFEELLTNGSYSKAFYAFSAGVCHIEAARAPNVARDCAADHASKGKAFFDQVPSLVRKRFTGKPLALEQYAAESSRRYLDALEKGGTPLAPYHEFLYFWNGFRQLSPAQLDATILRLREGLAGEASPGEKAALLLLLGCALREKREHPEALRLLEQATELADKLQKEGSADPLVKFAGPYSLYERALLKLETLSGLQDARALEEADDLLKRTGKANGFWFDMRLHTRVHYIFINGGR